MYGGRRYPGTTVRRYSNGRNVKPNQSSSYSKRASQSSNSSSAVPAKRIPTTPAKPPVESKAANEFQIEESPANCSSLTNESDYPYQEAYVEEDSIGYDETATEETTSSVIMGNINFKEEPTSNPADRYRFPDENVSSQNTAYQSKKFENFSCKQETQEKMRPTTPESKPSNIGNSNTQSAADSFDVNIVKSEGKRLVDLNSLTRSNERKFSGRARLFIANLQSNISESDLSKLFGKFGETNEVYVNRDKGFGFVRFDYKINAEIARNALDGQIYKGRYLKVRFAAHQSAIEIHGIDQFCSNESLETAFSIFGQVEKATVVCDERGKSKGYAIIEFEYKKAARIALQKINEGLFVLGRLPKPVTAKPLAQTDEDGIHEKDLERVPGILKDREYQARFVLPETPDYDLAKRWKDLEAAGELQKAELQKRLDEDRDKLEVEIETAVHESEADYIRQELLQRQAALEEEIRRYDEMRSKEASRRAMNLGQNQHNMHGFNPNRNEEARRQDEFIRKQQQELMRRHKAEDVMREMQNAAATVGMAGINQAALAMATGVGPASAAAAANILQAHAVVTQAMQGREAMMHRMPRPRAPMQSGMIPPRGMVGPVVMPQRGMFDPGQVRGNMRPGLTRQGSRDNFHSPNMKRPRY